MATQTQTPPQTFKPIPFVKDRPLLGSLSEYNSERLDLLLRITQECGDIGGMHFGPFPVLIFNTSDYVHAIFVEHAYDFDKGITLHSTFHPVFGNGLLMSDRQIIDECVTLFGAGHETTATALTWAWYLLCQHPHIYQRVQHEVDTVLQGCTPRYEDLPHLPYCLQVFKEALRLYPSAYIISRQALKDVSIDGYLVRKWETVAIAPYALHRRPGYFSDPETFDPERFTPQHEHLLPRYAYVPFGAGPRIYIGMYFAMMEGHLLLASLAERVSFELASQGSVEPDPYHTLTIRPGGGLPVIVRRRER